MKRVICSILQNYRQLLFPDKLQVLKIEAKIG